MEFNLFPRMRNVWNAFANRDPTHTMNRNIGPGDYSRIDRPIFSYPNRRTIASSVYNRIAMDAAAVDIKHVRVDDNDRFSEEIDSKLNYCLTVESNLDQTSRAFFQDVYMSLMDEGCIAIVPVDTTIDPYTSSSFDVLSMRTGKITQWYPQHVEVEVYNERSGKKERIVLSKNEVAIIENPLYAVMNEPNSTMKRLLRKMALLDAADEEAGSGRLDMIIKLPYSLRTERKKEEAKARRDDLERQLSDGKLGIGYIDATEQIVQLNRPLDNKLLTQIEYLTKMLFSELGITQEIMDGTADSAAMLNYNNRTIEPLVAAVTDEIRRKFLSKTARTQKQTIAYFRDPFRLVPVNDIAEIADKFTRNEIMTSNEIRQIIGMRPSKDPAADELRNKNLSAPAEDKNSSASVENIIENMNKEVENQNEV